MRKRRKLSFIALCLFAGACNLESGPECERLTESLENGASCVVASRNSMPVDSDRCDRDMRKFTKLGLTSLDAAKITQIGAEKFYETYYTDDFCEYMYPKWISRNFN